MVSDSTAPRKNGASLGLKANSMSSHEFGRHVIDKISRHLLWFLFLLFVFSFLDIRASRHPPSAVFASARAAAGALCSTAGSEQAHLYGITLLAPGGRRGCTSGCWYPDGTLPVDL